MAVKHVVAQRGDNIQDPTDYFDLMTSLIGRFSVREIIDSSVKMASYLCDIKFKMTPDDLKKDKILDTNMTQDDIINFHYFINFFMYRLYSSHDFIHGQLARITEEEELNLNEAYGTLLNKLLQYTEVSFQCALLIGQEIGDEKVDGFSKCLLSDFTIYPRKTAKNSKQSMEKQRDALSVSFRQGFRFSFSSLIG